MIKKYNPIFVPLKIVITLKFFKKCLQEGTFG